jgi:hypothetical protein
MVTADHMQQLVARPPHLPEGGSLVALHAPDAAPIAPLVDARVRQPHNGDLALDGSLRAGDVLASADGLRRHLASVTLAGAFT